MAEGKAASGIREQIKVVPDGEKVVLEATGEAGKCTVRMRLEEAERFRDFMDRAIMRAVEAREDREVEESSRIAGVHDGDDGA